MVMCLHLKGFFVTSNGPSLQQAQVTIASGDAAKCGYCVQTNTPQGFKFRFLWNLRLDVRKSEFHLAQFRYGISPTATDKAILKK